MNEIIIDEQNIKNKIYTIRGVQVMLDRDLAKLYQVETRVLKQAVKRNMERFPKDFMFELTDEEIDYTIKHFKKAVERLRTISSSYAKQQPTKGGEAKEDEH